LTGTRGGEQGVIKNVGGFEEGKKNERLFSIDDSKKGRGNKGKRREKAIKNQANLKVDTAPTGGTGRKARSPPAKKGKPNLTKCKGEVVGKQPIEAVRKKQKVCNGVTASNFSGWLNRLKQGMKGKEEKKKHAAKRHNKGDPNQGVESQVQEISA